MNAKRKGTLKPEELPGTCPRFRVPQTECKEHEVPSSLDNEIIRLGKWEVYEHTAQVLSSHNGPQAAVVYLETFPSTYPISRKDVCASSLLPLVEASYVYGWPFLLKRAIYRTFCACFLVSA
jgi:hypothetical protein